jgi:hypothetical protein
MPLNVMEHKFSLKCRQCGATGVPVRVDSQTPTTIVLAVRCRSCALEWTAEGHLPVFLAWVKPDRRRRTSAGGTLLN